MCVRMIHEEAREASKSHIRVNHSCTQRGGHAMAQLGAAWRSPTWQVAVARFHSPGWRPVLATVSGLVLCRARFPALLPWRE